MSNSKGHSFYNVTVPEMTQKDREEFLKNYEKEFKEAFAPDPEDSCLPADKDPPNKEKTSS